jgi:hypothetical protein
MEVIVVDDGSTDEGPAIVADYNRIPVRLLRQENAGPGAARNLGINAAQGDFVAFLDADDEWLPRFLEVGMQKLKEHPEAALVTTGMWESPPDVFREDMWRRRGLHSGLWRVNPEMQPMQLAHLLFFLSPCATIARTGVVRRFGGFYSRNRCRFGEDLMLWLKVILNHPVYIHLEPLIRVYRSASELSGNVPGPRPIEPLLTDTDEVRRVCPDRLQPLLSRLCGTLACKTACMLGYWGHWRDARSLLKQHVTWSDRNSPFFLPAILSCLPLTGVVGPAAVSVIRKLAPNSGIADVRQN